MAKSCVRSLIALWLMTWVQLEAAETPEIQFARDIAPILSENCFACHGPDEGQRKSRLRLDHREDALKPAKSGERAIVPGDVAQSELIARITTEDPDDLMPPPSTGKQLTSQQIDLLRRWIESGANWQTHWAFVAPTRPDPPAVKQSSWVRNEIDRFVLGRLEKEKLAPAPEAEKTTLIRRASLDVTGLPPSIAEVESFLANDTPEAYDQLVDRLLASPRYGEHQSRYWLDAVRYADTHGYHIDARRDMWKYRDWVIQAFNENKPFDEFTTEQLAGDLLPDATLEQKIATGYVRANMTTGEGGVIEDEYRAKYTFDRLETTGATYLGMTLLCARCHTHKYDPIEHREYYSLYAIFNQVADPVMDQNKPDPEPILKVPSPEQAARMAWLKEHVEKGQHQIDAPMPELDGAQSAWVKEWSAKLSQGWAVLEPDQARSALTNGAQLRVLEDHTVLAEGPSPESEVYELTFSPKPGPIHALRLDAIPSHSLPQNGSGRAPDGTFWLSEIEVDLVRPTTEGQEGKSERLKFAFAVADAEAQDRGLGRALDGKPETGWQVPEATAAEPHRAVFVLREPLEIGVGSELKVRLRHEAAKTNSALGQFRISAGIGEELRGLLHPPKFKPWQVLGPLPSEEPKAALTKVYPPEQGVDLKKKYPGVREEVSWAARDDLPDGKASVLVPDLHGVHGVRYLYRTITVPAARPLELSLRADGLFRLWVNDEMIAERDHEEGVGEGPLKVTAHLREGENRFLLKVVTVQGASYLTFNPDLGSADRLTAEIAAMVAASPKLTGQNETKVRNYFRRQYSPEFRKTYDQVVDWRQERESIERAIPTTMIAKESETPRETFILLRGEYDKKGEKVTAGVPAIFPPIPEGAPTNRLGLAQWLLDPGHPLTARVTVNRFWQQYFGVGLVKTAEDFGLQGDQPSHPELLDWLATEFIRSGWDVKHMHRLILASAAYRQSSRATKELITRDPENRLLARGPRFRLDAEAVRDTALYVSGLLVEKVGGRSVRPYEPPGLWEEVSFNNSQKYIQDTGEAQYRRSLYTYWKRQSPPPTMILFDAPSREYCTVRRSRANTPLQALALLNDPQFVEASRAFAHRIMAEGGPSVDSRIQFAFRATTARPPSSEELTILRDLLREQLETFKADATGAEQLLSVGPLSTPAALDRIELAAWTILASLLLNLDETITKG